MWFKNFALSRLAHENDALPVNLVIDNDTVKHVSLRVPGGSLDAPLVESIAFDVASDEIPYEERDVEDRALFADFGERAAAWIHGVVPNPLMNEFWPLVRERAAVTRNLGQCLAQARHGLEGEWGLADAGDSAEPGLRVAGISLVYCAFAGRPAAVPRACTTTPSTLIGA